MFSLKLGAMNCPGLAMHAYTALPVISASNYSAAKYGETRGKYKNKCCAIMPKVKRTEQLTEYRKTSNKRPGVY